MRFIKKTCLFVIAVLIFGGCANEPDIQQQNQTSVSDHPADEITETRPVSPEESGEESTAVLDDRIEIEFGKIYTTQEYMPIFEKWRSGLSDKMSKLNEHFEEDVSSGKIPQTVLMEYMGETYELYLKCDQYIYSEYPELLYDNPVHRIQITVDAETMGLVYSVTRTSVLACTFPVGNLEKKTEEELIRIANDYFEPLFGARQIERDEYTVFIEYLDYYELPHIDTPSKNYSIRYLYNNPHALYATLAHITIDEYGFISTATFNPDQYYLDKVFLSRLPEIDYDKILGEIEVYREHGCDCGLSMITSLQKHKIDGRELALMTITIVPDEKGSAEHIHDYINNSLYIFYELTD